MNPTPQLVAEIGNQIEDELIAEGYPVRFANIISDQAKITAGMLQLATILDKGPSNRETLAALVSLPIFRQVLAANAVLLLIKMDDKELESTEGNLLDEKKLADEMAAKYKAFENRFLGYFQ